MPFLKDKSEYAVSTWTLYTKPLDTALALIRDAGFEAVEIWADSIHLDPRLKPDVAKVRGLVRENGQHVHSLHSPVLYGSFPHPQEEKAFREHRKAILKETLDYASELESPIVVIHGHHGKYYPYTMNDADVLCDTIAELADHGKKRGVRLAMENLPHDPGENGITWSLRFQSQLYKALDVGYCLDIGHTPIVGDGDNFTEIDAVAENLISFHVHNNDGLHDSHNLPDDGVLDWTAIHDHARAKGYKGEFVLEVLGGKDEIETLRRIEALFH